jgi:hypothetical protein
MLPKRPRNPLHPRAHCPAEFAFVGWRGLLESRVRKFLIFLSLWVGLTAGVYAAETFTLTDGTSMSGDISKADDYDVMIHTTSDTFTNIQWPRFSQETLKQLAGNPKYAAWAGPFIQPTAPAQTTSENIPIKPVTRMTLPDHPSILGGMVSSSLGLFMLLVIYAANLYAAFEVAVVRGKPIGAVMGLSAVLPIIGPIIFLAQPIKAAATEEAPLEEGMPGGPPPPGAAPAPGQEDIQIVAASWQGSQEEKKPQPQVFSRGKFTLNKRFIETKFANFIGEPKGDAKNFTMEIKTLKDTIAVECIKQVGATDAILETPTGQLTLQFSDIQEIKLTPKPA